MIKLYTYVDNSKMFQLSTIQFFKLQHNKLNQLL